MDIGQRLEQWEIFYPAGTAIAIDPMLPSVERHLMKCCEKNWVLSLIKIIFSGSLLTKKGRSGKNKLSLFRQP